MEAERRHKKREWGTERLPLHIKDITADWLSKALGGEHPGVVVHDMEIVEIIHGHTTKLRLNLDLNQAGLDANIPKRVCLKGNLEFERAEWSAMPATRPICVNEALFYHFFRESLGDFNLPAPNCYFAGWDDDKEGQQGIVVIDDLVELGGTLSKVEFPVDVEEMARSLEILANMHGSTWGSDKLKKQRWLQTAFAPETTADDWWAMAPQVFEAAGNIPERIALFPKWLADNHTRLRKAFSSLCAHESSNKGPRCLIHGDAHMSNTYLKPNGKRIWYDWQFVRKGLPWRDIVEHMIGSLTVEDRRKSERDLLRHYLDHFAVAGGARINLDDAWDEYRRMVVWGIWAWQSNINPVQDTLPPLERFCTAAKDLETHTLLGING